MIPRLTLASAFVMMGLFGTGCVVKTGEAADDPHHHHHHHDSPPPKKDPPKKQESKKEAPAPTPAAPEEKWEKLSETIANGKNDVDTVILGKSEGTFRRLRLTVTNSNLVMKDMVVHFADNTTFSPTTRLEFKEGATSREIDLPGGRRVIKTVDFKYSDGKGTGNAHIEMFGLR